MKLTWWAAILGLAFFAREGLAKERVLRTAFQENAPPRYFQEGTAYAGICVDIIEALNVQLARADLRIEVEEVASLTRIFGLLGSGEIDLFLGMGKTPEREKAYVFSREPLFDLDYVFAKRSSDHFEYTGEASLSGKRVGTLKGVWNEAVLRSIPGVEVDGVRKMALNMQKLISGRLDLVSYHDLGLRWEIWRSGLEGDIVFAKNPLRKDQQYVIFSRTLEENIVAIVNDALFCLKAEGNLERILDVYKK